MSSRTAAASAHYLQFRMQYSSLAVLYYDYALTFPDELRYIWRFDSLKRLSTLLYILCRYALLGNLLYLLAISGKIGDHCNTWYKAIAALSVLGRAAVVFVLGMRAYAMCSRNKIVLAVLLPLGIAIPALDIVENLDLSCSTGSSQQAVPIANDVLSISIPVYDFIAAMFTIIRGVQSLRSMRVEATRGELQRTLQYLLVEQGILYYIAISAITITVSVLDFRPPTAGAIFLTHLNAFAVPVSGLLTARFLLRLRAANSHNQAGNSSFVASGAKEGGLSALRFDNANHAPGGSTDFTDTDTGLAGPLPSGNRGLASGVNSSPTWSLRRAVDSVIDEFGDDPVYKIKEMSAIEASAVEQKIIDGEGALDIVECDDRTGERGARVADEENLARGPSASDSPGLNLNHEGKNGTPSDGQFVQGSSAM